MKKHSLSYHILLFLLAWSILPFMGGGSVMAQKNVITRLKVVAGRFEGDTQKKRDWAFSWFTTDMHKGSGDDYVYLGYKSNAEGWSRQDNKFLSTSESMITGVIVRDTHKSRLNGVPHIIKDGDKIYELIEYDQVSDKHKDRDGAYRGSLRGRYGVSWHNHIYISHTRSNDYRNTQVLSGISLHTSSVKGAVLGGGNLNSNSACERYLTLSWHTHVPIYSVPNAQQHRVTCNGCYLDQYEPHSFLRRHGVEVRTMYPRYEANGNLSKQAAEYHYKTCTICGYKHPEKHDFYNPTASESEHSVICKYCGYSKQASHRDYGKEKMPLNDSIHAMSCGECAYIGYAPHSFGAPVSVQWQRCDEGVASFKCIECDYVVHRKIEGLGHDFTDKGVCRRPGCIYRFIPAERDSTGTYHIRNIGNLYWFAAAVNQGATDINAVLDNDIAGGGPSDSEGTLIPQPVSLHGQLGGRSSDPEWIPIGNTPSHAYSGTFDAANHVITGIATRSMTNQDRTKGIFGYVGTKGTVKDLVVVAAQINGWSDLGIIAGRNDGIISGCTVSSGRVTAGMAGAYLGGICGINGGTIKDCHVSQHVWLGTRSHVVGGICGNNSGSISAVTTKAIYAQEDTNPLPPIGNNNNDK